MKRDPWKYEQRYRRWLALQQQGIKGLSAENSGLVLRYLKDMQLGRNTAAGTRKGGRSFARLWNLRMRLCFVLKSLQTSFDVVDAAQIDDETLHEYFGAMHSGEIRRRDGKRYRSVGDYVKVFKSFWHWHMKVNRKQGVQLVDVCEDLDYRSRKGRWVYLTEEEVLRLAEEASFERRVLILFLYDSGMRAPTEVLNLRVDDLDLVGESLRIREEASKTFGRTIRLTRSLPLLKRYLGKTGKSESDYLFDFHPPAVNKYLKRLAGRVLGVERTQGGKRYNELTFYDFRHSSACYWLPLYKSESGLKYRFGWKRSRMIEYYTGFLGMRDTITDDDLPADLLQDARGGV